MYHDSTTNGRVLGLPEALSHFPEISESLWKAADSVFPVRITRSWFNRIRRIDDPIARQAFPSQSELESHPEDLFDPVGEFTKMPHDWVIQKHKDRALLITTKRCHLYCRYCFRRTHSGAEDPTQEELDSAIDYLLESGVQEVILSGGDPLAVRHSRLAHILTRLKGIPIVRIHTRAPITQPSVVKQNLLELLRKHSPIWIVLHSNHPDELNKEVINGISKFTEWGIPLLNQSVLLKGINDDAEILADLSRKLLQNKVFPYYLHHTDRVAGNVAFRVNLDRGIEVYQQLTGLVSGIALPRYVIDPPDGAGKIDVLTYLQRRKNGDSSCDKEI
jgi:lysine 2,3-aminomutase